MSEYTATLSAASGPRSNFLPSGFTAVTSNRSLKMKAFLLDAALAMITRRDGRHRTRSRRVVC